MKVKELFEKVKTFTSENSPAILTGITCAGVVLTFASAYKAGPKAERIIEKYKYVKNEVEKNVKNDPDLTDEDLKKEKRHMTANLVKDLAPVLAPPIIFGTLSIACAICSNRISSKRVSALTAAYQISTGMLRDYKDKIKELVPKKAEEIKESVITDHLKDKEATDENKDVYTRLGKMPCVDIYTKVEFYSTRAEIEKAINKMSARVRNEMYINLYDLYYELGVDPRDIPSFAYDIGWHESDCIEGNLPITIATCWDKSETVPMIGLNYEIDPFYKEGGRFR